MSVHEVLPMKKLIIAVAVIVLGAVAGYAQGTPTLALAAGKVGITSGQNGTASNFKFQMESSGWPRAVTAGETIFMMGTWPTAHSPTMSDDKSNTWASAVTCNDSSSLSHGFFYAVNAAANTSMITETHSTQIKDTVFDWAHFYNMSTTASGFVDGSSCRTGVTPVNNTVPNITGTAYSTATNGDLILTCVYVEQASLTFAPTFTSVTWPSSFTGLSEEASYGHACAYGVQATAGSFTPTFTIAQGTHSTFTIISAAFKAGFGGTAPGTGATILLSEMHYAPSSGQTDTVNLPCPNGTTAVAVSDEWGNLNSVSDNVGNTFAHPAFQGAHMFYANSPTISNGNTYTVSMHWAAAGNWILAGLYCLGGTNGIDTAATARNTSTLDGAGSGTTYNTCVQSGNNQVDCPSIGTSVPGDLILASGGIGLGPATGCVTGKCVFDYVGSTTWSGGDNESYANGDSMGHLYAPTAGTWEFQYTLDSGVLAGNSTAIAFKPASSQGTGPAPPTGLGVTVH